MNKLSSIGKKGSLIFVPTLVVMSFVLVGYAAVLFQMQKPVTRQSIGEAAASLMESYSDGEGFLFYLDKSAEYAANDAVYDLASNGGLKEGGGCIKKDDYIIWHKNCRPSKERHETSFIRYFENRFNGYIGILYANRKPGYEYDFEAADGKLTFKGMSINPFVVQVEGKITGEKAKTGIVLPEDCKQDYSKVEAESQRYENIINKYAQLHDMETIALKCMIKQESDFKSDAISDCGAAGLMQLMPGTASDEGIKNLFNGIKSLNAGCDGGYAKNLREALAKDPNGLKQEDGRFDPEQNIKAGSGYIKKQLNSFGDLRLALAAYNAGPGNIRRSNMMIPPITETQRYVGCIMKCIDENKQKESKISGAAVGTENFNAEEVEALGVYGANASFIVKLDHDFSVYDEIYSVMDEKAKNGCLLDPPDEDIKNCFSDEIGMRWNALKKEGDVVYMEVDTGKKIERFNKIEDDSIIIRFGINLANWEKPEEVEF